MIVLIPLILLPLVGLVVALYRRSFAARVIGVGLAVVPAVFSILMLVVAHRLAGELDFPGQPPSQEWPRGVDTMRSVTNKSILMLATAVLGLTVISLLPYPATQSREYGASPPTK